MIRSEYANRPKRRQMGFRERVTWRVLSRISGGAVAARRLGAVVGDGCRIYSFNVQSEPWLVRIGSRVTITSGVQLITHDGATWLARDARGRRYRYGPITIGDDVFVGVNAVILPGVVVGPRVIVAAGAVVARSVPEGSVVAGVPARRIGTYDDYVARALSSLEWDNTRAFELAESLLEHSEDTVCRGASPLRTP